ncbi:MAG: HAMP domain-containing histidine kinase [Gammaproteobacteria bacterium]|nr:HAMP domain-containing histidine kinase [Gammaproteobacteria bacterium]
MTNLIQARSFKPYSFIYFSLLGVVVLLALISGIMSYQFVTNAYLDPWEDRQKNQIFKASLTLDQAFVDALKISGFTLEAFKSMMAELPVPVTAESFYKRYQNMPEWLIEIFTTTPNLYQMRLLAPSGDELVRYEKNSANNLISYNFDRLQNKASRDYFIAGQQIGEFESLFTAIDLNREFGVIERPLRPTFRAIKPLIYNQQRYLVVLNFDFTQTLNNIQSSPPLFFEIINREGYWLKHPDNNYEWGHLLNQAEHNLRNQNPSFWSSIHNINDQQLGHSGNAWFARSRSSSHPLVDFNRANDLVLISRLSDEYVAGIKQNVFWWISLSLLLMTGLTLFFLHRFFTLSEQRNQHVRELNAERASLKLVNRQLSRAFERNEHMQQSLIEEQKLSALGLIVAGVAHELNTPIGSMQLITSELKSYLNQLNSNTNANAAETIEALHEGLAIFENSLNAASDKISSFKRFAADRKQDGLREFVLNDTLNALVSALDVLFKEHQAQVKLMFDESIPLTHDPGFVSLVVQNLIENAIYHAYPVNAIKKIDVKFSATRDNTVTIIVKDYGVGIDTEKQKRLFDPFFTTGRGHGHIGLGLHLVYLWVNEVLRGEIKVVSEVNSGTEFIITMPQHITLSASPEGTAPVELIRH